MNVSKYLVEGQLCHVLELVRKTPYARNDLIFGVCLDNLHPFEIFQLLP